MTHKTVKLALPPAVWKLAERLQKILNVKLRAIGKPPLNLSGVVNAILLNALLENAKDIQDEYDQIGLEHLASRLAGILGPDGVAAAGLPEVPDGGGARGRTRSSGFFL